MKFNEAKLLRNQLAKFKAEAPKMTDVMLTIALNHSVENFRKQGFEDVGVEKWKTRKTETSRERKRTERVGNRAILVKSGALRRSLRKKKLTAFSGTISSPLIYAKVHNDGLRTGRGSGFKMPKRQFVGNSSKMVRKIENALAQKIDRIFK